MRLYQVGNHETEDFLDPTTLKPALGQLKVRLENQHSRNFETKLRGGEWRKSRGLYRTLLQVSNLVTHVNMGDAVWTQDVKNHDPVFVIRPVLVKVEDWPSTSTYTPAAKRCWYDVMVRFDGLVSWGIFVCKDILGSSTYSQHSWGNAIDFHGSVDRMRELAEYLRKNAKRLDCHYVIYNHRISENGGAWRAYSGDNPHIDHVHVDFNPEKTGVPACA